MKVLVVVFFVICPFIAAYQFNMTEYRKMPPLYSFDDYDDCLQSPEMSSYCLVIAEIVPNATWSLWNQIANFSSDNIRHYRHDNPVFGVCVNQCKDLLHHLSPNQTEQLYSGQIKNTELVEFFTDIGKRESDNRILYDKLINTCLNHKFRPRYGLQLRSFVEYCDTNQDPKPLDFLEIIFIVTVCTLLTLAVICTSYDRQLRNKDSISLPGNEFYKQELHTQRDKLLTSFSIYRNYYRLVQPLRGELAQDLRFFDGYRFIATVIVIYAHVLMMLKSIPLLNTEFIEETYHSIAASIFTNGTAVIQVFLIMSSFLLCIGFQKHLASKNPGFSEWVQIISSRYLRLAPSLGFMILMNASILPRLQDGPFWRQVVDAEYVFCRETWWRNLLFINNFTLRKSCLHQTWYLAADFQLYLILAAVLIFIARFPKTRNYVLAAGVMISFLSTGLVTYFLELDAMHKETPNSYRYYFWTNGKTIYKGYTPFYTNFGGFVFGTITGLIFLKYKNESKNLKKNKTKLNIITLLCIPMLILMLLSGEIFLRFEFTKPSIWIAIYAGLFRNIWAILSCSILLLMSFKLGALLFKFSAMKVFVPLGRISYQAYLVHMLVIRCVIGSLRQPLYLNQTMILTFVLTCVVVSFFGALFLYMLVEIPLATILNMTAKTERRKNLKSTIQTSLGLKKETTDIPATS